ncbi:MAG: molybdenum cofactor guanylyltransferase [Anaerolineales bacterium]|nr:molybdenum cofactor guanylyltransferase [Anaerolineales bacterium]
MQKNLTTQASIAILAGGKSRRMGQDKGLIPLLGIPLVKRVLLQVECLSEHMMLITNRPSEYRSFGIPMQGDLVTGAGPLGGLYSALHYSTSNSILALSCDMPFVCVPLLQHMLGLASECDAVVPRLGGSRRVEPLRAVYNQRCKQSIANALEEGQRRMISFFDLVEVRYVEIDEIERFDPGARSFFNINTPDDLKQARSIATLYPLP